MTEAINRGLLPAGLPDLLPSDAAHEAGTVERLMAEFARHGYERVKPPLIEFEASLLAGAGQAVANQSFRLMDPVSQSMLALRADITPQVARIATTRLRNEPRPLRLSYAGQVLRTRGTQLRPEREFGQAGVELIGAFQPAADAEVVVLAARALRAAGVEGLSVDLNVPTLVPAACRALDLGVEETTRLRAALDRRDAADVAAVGGRAGELALALMAASGPAERAIGRLAALDLPSAAEADRARLTEVVRLVREAAPDLMLTVDPVEHRGFEYQTGTSFTLFARGVRGELGRGGRYRAHGAAGGIAASADAEPAAGEPSTGFTLYLDTVVRAVPVPAAPARLYLPFGTPAAEAARRRADGWITVAALEPAADPAAEAGRLRCSHVLADGRPREIASGDL
ncbi:MAG TPA: ATP phosphoribosyltransferase regulatory subunit [Arenibaculum sp.]|nr:ATP phosphoribosyltransferase regulatory subunit [Arenibaculum sp.]